MRYFVLASVAIGLFIAMMNFGALGAVLRVAITLSCSIFFGYYLWAGFRTKTMEAPGVGYLAGHRTESPILFWFCTAFNGIMFVVTIIIAAKLAGL
ncbi:MAG: hypothetical protein BGO58_06560 [Sphingopyxis sp. 65-8]|uniref:hypothetical protein n=1 Tax=Sphingopyxis terrae TaxID=33052 RepID=UPI00095921FA|nr:hypothetical protein [Sphingopyxis terrae]OJW21315.1 MAG: hypothetical protein BGO58_06560 [Sphingopyxis sp. 65-8]HRE34063.1 hypothetical protein [Sphingopyxis terrae]